MLTQEEQNIIDQSIDILTRHYKREDFLATSPEGVKNFCQLKMGLLEHEVFGCLFLDSKHQLIKFVEMFRGTVGGLSVYPREVVKESLMCNAAAVVFTHNHPSGDTDPSTADIETTNRLCEALQQFEVRVLDHIIVSRISSYSFAEKGLNLG